MAARDGLLKPLLGPPKTGAGLGLTDGPRPAEGVAVRRREGGGERVDWWNQGHFTASAKRLRAEPRGLHPNGDLTDSFVPSDGRAVHPQSARSPPDRRLRAQRGSHAQRASDRAPGVPGATDKYMVGAYTADSPRSSIRPEASPGNDAATMGHAALSATPSKVR